MDIVESLNQYGLTKEQYEECLQTIIAKRNGDLDIDWQEIVQKYRLPISVDSLRRVNNGIFGGGFVAEYCKSCQSLDTKESVEEISKSKNISFNKDGSMSSSMFLNMTEEEAKNPEFILKAHGFDIDAWEIASCRNTVRQVVSKVVNQVDDNGKLVDQYTNKGKPVYTTDVRTLYASYITVKPRKDKEISLAKIEEFFNKLDRNYSVPKIEKTKDYLEGDKMLLIDIADLHHNLQASMMTSGNDYDCDIAEQLFFYVLNDVLSRTAHYYFEKIVFVVGGDIENSDYLTGATVKGTPQDNDLHYYEACERLYAMTIKAIDMLKEVAPVDIILCVGNHDEVTCYKLAKYISAWFRNEDRVNVDYTPLARKYKLYGKTLLCFAHDGKVQKLPALIADEARQYWAQADTVEVFLQHLHTEQVLMEDNNIRIQRLPTISARSKWSSDKGYSSKRQCKSFIFDKEDGLTDILYTPIKVNK